MDEGVGAWTDKDKEKRSTMPEHTLKKSTMPQGFFHASFSMEFLGSEYFVKKECEILGVEE